MKLLDPRTFDAPDPPAPADPIGQLRLRFKGDPDEDPDHPMLNLSACAIAGRAMSALQRSAKRAMKRTMDCALGRGVTSMDAIFPLAA